MTPQKKDAGCWMLDAGCWMLGRSLPSIQHLASSIFFIFYLSTPPLARRTAKRISKTTSKTNKSRPFDNQPEPRRVLGRDPCTFGVDSLFTPCRSSDRDAEGRPERLCFRPLSPFRTNSLGKATSLKMSSFEGFKDRSACGFRFEGLLHLCTSSPPSNAAHRPAGVCRN